MKRGVEEIVAIVLLVAIAVIAAVSIYFWTAGLATKQPTPKNPIAIVANPIGGGKVLIANLGQKPINTSTLKTSSGSISCPAEELGPEEQVLCVIFNATGEIAIWGNGTGSTIIHLPENETGGGSGNGSGSGSGSENGSSGQENYWPVQLSGDLYGYGVSGNDIVVVTSGSVNVTVINATTGKVICNNDIHRIVDTSVEAVWIYGLVLPTKGDYIYIPVKDKEGAPGILKFNISQCQPVALGLSDEGARSTKSIAIAGDKAVFSYVNSDKEYVLATFNATNMSLISKQRYGADILTGVGTNLVAIWGRRFVGKEKLKWTDDGSEWDEIRGSATKYEVSGDIDLKDALSLTLLGGLNLPSWEKNITATVNLLTDELVTAFNSSSALWISGPVYNPNSNQYFMGVANLDSYREYMVSVSKDSHTVSHIKEVPADEDNESIPFYGSGKEPSVVYYYTGNNTLNKVELVDSLSSSGTQLTVSADVDSTTNASGYYKLSCSSMGFDDDPDPTGVVKGGATPVDVSTNVPAIVMVTANGISGLEDQIRIIGIEDLKSPTGGQITDSFNGITDAVFSYGGEDRLSKKEGNEANGNDYDRDQGGPIQYLAFHTVKYGDVYFPVQFNSTTIKEPTRNNAGVLEKCKEELK